MPHHYGHGPYYAGMHGFYDGTVFPEAHFMHPKPNSQSLKEANDWGLEYANKLQQDSVIDPHVIHSGRGNNSEYTSFHPV